MRHIKKQDGLTLIEVIISFNLIIVLIVAFTGAVLVGLNTEETSRKIDIATSMSSSIFDFLEDRDNLKKIVNNEIDISTGSYNNQLRYFIEDDIENSLLNSNFTDLFQNYSSNDRFNYLEKSKIEINYRDDIIENLYNIKLDIYWQSDQGEGNFTIETMIGAD